jgi:quercetin dioxygenase-like cupin family protein
MQTVAQAQLRHARTNGSGRSSATVYKGQRLSHTVVALVAGTELSEHENPGEVTAQVLLGRIEVQAGNDTWEGHPGNLLVVPAARHSVRALDDSAFLLTVVRRD